VCARERRKKGLTSSVDLPAGSLTGVVSLCVGEVTERRKRGVAYSTTLKLPEWCEPPRRSDGDMERTSCIETCIRDTDCTRTHAHTHTHTHTHTHSPAAGSVTVFNLPKRIPGLLLLRLGANQPKDLLNSPSGPVCVCVCLRNNTFFHTHRQVRRSAS